MGAPYLGSTCCGCSNASGIKGPKIAALAPSPAGMSLGELAALRRPALVWAGQLQQCCS